MNTEDRPATRDTDSPYPREGLELVVPEEPDRLRTRAGQYLYEGMAIRGLEHKAFRSVKAVEDEAIALALGATPRMVVVPPHWRLPGWLARLVGRRP